MAEIEQHKNPPLQSLNLQSRADDAFRKGEVDDTVAEIERALRMQSNSRRMQKPLVAPKQVEKRT